MRDDHRLTMHEAASELPLTAARRRGRDDIDAAKQQLVGTNDDEYSSTGKLVDSSDEDSGYHNESRASPDARDDEDGDVDEDEFPQHPSDDTSSTERSSEDDEAFVEATSTTSQGAESRLAASLELLVRRASRLPPGERSHAWALARTREMLGDVLPESLLPVAAGFAIEGECRASGRAGTVDVGARDATTPAWLDREKFHRGQLVGLEYYSGLVYAQMLSLFVMFSFRDGLRPLVLTGASSTPYSAFKRYLSTGLRVRNWMTSDPWMPGTAAYNDMNYVRKVHNQIRKQLVEMPSEEFRERSTVKNPWCPMQDVTRQDFNATCPVPKIGQCPYNLAGFQLVKLSQGEMSSTQFAFCSLFLLYPKFFGAHQATEDDLDAFCHYWRGLGYLLGIEDQFNFCQGTLEDVRRRSRDYIEYWVKPNFRIITPDWEHMMRCMVEGVHYYFPGSSYETSLLDLAHLFDIHMPRLYNSLPFFDWIKHIVIRFVFNCCYKVARIRAIFNSILVQALEKAKNFDERKHEDLQLKSAKTIDPEAIGSQRQKISKGIFAT